MKFLVSSFPYAGHFNPLQPIVKELIRRGHQVVWITGKAYEARVTALGATFYPMSADALIHDHDDWHSSTGMTGIATLMTTLRRVFIDRVIPRVFDYIAVLEDFPADLLLVDFRPAGAHVLRDLTGIPYVTLGINPLVTPDPEIPPWGTREQPPKTLVGRWWNAVRHYLGNRLVHRKLMAALNERRGELRLPPLPLNTSFHHIMYSEVLHIMMTTPAFEFPRANIRPSVKFVGPLLPVVDDNEFVPPAWWADMKAFPRERVVHVTQGTMHAEDADLVQTAVRALADHDELLVVVTGAQVEILMKDVKGCDKTQDDGIATFPTPANVRWAPFIPHTKLLPHIGVMVTNAGYNGVLAALSFGVPVICAGRTEDKPEVSSRVAWAGVGLDLRTDKPTVAALRKAILGVLRNPQYREAAMRVQDDFSRHDGPVEAANELERVVAGGTGPATWPHDRDWV